MLNKTLIRRLVSKIKTIRGRELLDSRGFPTCEAELTTDHGLFSAMVPSGASTGIYEAFELRDNDKRYLGKGVLKAVSNINEVIGPALVGESVLDQLKLDNAMVQKLDGSKNQYGYQKSNLGANSILAVSLALARAGAQDNEQHLFEYIADLSGNSESTKFVMPVPSFNVINGGNHSDNMLAFQEFMIMPLGAKTFKEAVQIGSEIFHTLKKNLKEKYGPSSTNVGDEGGFSPTGLNNVQEVISLLKEAISESGNEGKIGIAMDVAASEFYDSKTGKYDLDFKNKDSTSKISGEEFLAFYVDLVEKNPEIVSIEDPFDQDDFHLWTDLTSIIGDKVQIVGDDLLVTNPSRIALALEQKCCNCLLLKVNQIGTLSEAIEACNIAQDNEWGVMVSHRSGETEDHFIADLAVGLGSGQIKTGGPSRSERTAKYNQLIRIEERLGENSVYAGWEFRNLNKC